MAQWTGYLCKEEHLPIVRAELKGVREVYDNLILADGPPQRCYWAQNLWLDPYYLSFESVRDAADQLRAIQRNWALYSYSHHRRGALIRERLPHVSAKVLQFPAALPRAPLGSYLLVDQHRLLAAPRCTSPVVHGEFRFEERKVGPPNRAYLKLWEALTRMQLYPQPGERCLEAGASPGGWSWVLASLGASVYAVDRAPLAPNVAAMPGVEFHKGDAFAVRPGSHGRFDWVLSDLIATPEKLYEWVKEWVRSGACTHLICTIKFRGRDYGMVPKFAALPNATLVHLTANKHELTCIVSSARSTLDTTAASDGSDS